MNLLRKECSGLPDSLVSDKGGLLTFIAMLAEPPVDEVEKPIQSKTCQSDRD